MLPFMGILSRKSQFSSVNLLIPSPSAPITSAAGPVKSVSYRPRSPLSYVPNIQMPRLWSCFMVRARLVT